MSSLPLITDPPAGFAATRNSCQGAPAGACLVFRGIEGAIPLLHGSQGCSTYIRRYLIGHFREPVDIASSNFSEGAAVYGGGSIFRQGLENVIRQYAPALVGIATTCLSETIGDDIRLYLHEFRRDHRDRPLPELVHVSTPSYSGTHTEGFHAAVQAVVAAGRGRDAGTAGERPARDGLARGLTLPQGGAGRFRVAGHPPAGLLRHAGRPLLGRVPAAAGRGHGRGVVAGDGERPRLSSSATLDPARSAAGLLEERFGVRRHGLGMPIGIRQSDAFFDLLAGCAGRPVPDKHLAERGRLVDSYIDAQVFVRPPRRGLRRGGPGCRPDLLPGRGGHQARALCVRRAERRLAEAVGPLAPEAVLRDGVDFLALEEAAASLRPDLFVGDSKGYPLSASSACPWCVSASPSMTASARAGCSTWGTAAPRSWSTGSPTP